MEVGGLALAARGQCQQRCDLVGRQLEDTLQRGGRGGDEPAGFVFEAGDLPDMTPVARWLLGAFAFLVALGVGGALASDWQQLLLWMNRVPFSPSATVTDIRPARSGRTSSANSAMSVSGILIVPASSSARRAFDVPSLTSGARNIVPPRTRLAP